MCFKTIQKNYNLLFTICSTKSGGLVTMFQILWTVHYKVSKSYRNDQQDAIV